MTTRDDSENSACFNGCHWHLQFTLFIGCSELDGSSFSPETAPFLSIGSWAQMQYHTQPVDFSAAVSG